MIDDAGEESPLPSMLLSVESEGITPSELMVGSWADLLVLFIKWKLDGTEEMDRFGPVFLVDIQDVTSWRSFFLTGFWLCTTVISHGICFLGGTDVLAGLRVPCGATIIERLARPFSG